MRRILAEAGRVDAAENARFDDARGDELPPELRNREERLQRLREARERLAARERERQEDYEERVRRRAAKDPRGRCPKPPPPAAGAKVNSPTRTAAWCATITATSRATTCRR